MNYLIFSLNLKNRLFLSFYNFVILFLIFVIMKKEFLIHLNEGYRKRKYDLDKIKIEKFIDSFFRFLFFLEYQRCISQYEINNRLETFKIEF